jgi:hypothetical protein
MRDCEQTNDTLVNTWRWRQFHEVNQQNTAILLLHLAAPEGIHRSARMLHLELGATLL